MNRKRKYGEGAIAGAALEAWPNPAPKRAYHVEISFPEFTCLCPRSGYPDFATIGIRYIPARLIVELRSLKLYLNRFRSQPISHEAVTNQVYQDLAKALRPRFLEVVGDFHPRGNVKTVIRVGSDSSPLQEKGAGAPGQKSVRGQATSKEDGYARQDG